MRESLYKVVCSYDKYNNVGIYTLEQNAKMAISKIQNWLKEKKGIEEVIIIRKVIRICDNVWNYVLTWQQISNDIFETETLADYIKKRLIEEDCIFEYELKRYRKNDFYDYKWELLKAEKEFFLNHNVRHYSDTILSKFPDPTNNMIQFVVDYGETYTRFSKEYKIWHLEEAFKRYIIENPLYTIENFQNEFKSFLISSGYKPELIEEATINEIMKNNILKFYYVIAHGTEEAYDSEHRLHNYCLETSNIDDYYFNRLKKVTDEYFSEDLYEKLFTICKYFAFFFNGQIGIKYLKELLEDKYTDQLIKIFYKNRNEYFKLLFDGPDLSLEIKVKLLSTIEFAYCGNPLLPIEEIFNIKSITNFSYIDVSNIVNYYGDFLSSDFVSVFDNLLKKEYIKLEEKYYEIGHYPGWEYGDGTRTTYEKRITKDIRIIREDVYEEGTRWKWSGEYSDYETQTSNYFIESGEKRIKISGSITNDAKMLILVLDYFGLKI